MIEMLGLQAGDYKEISMIKCDCTFHSRSVWSIVLALMLLAPSLGIYSDAALATAAYTGADSGALSPTGVASPDCVDFEGLALAATYVVGDVFLDSGAVVSAQPFVWSDGTPTSGGFAMAVNSGLAGGSGLEMAVNNINLAFDFGGVLSGLFLRFGEYGGNLNIEVNGDFRNFEDFADIDGLTFGGTTVAVTNGNGNDAGTLRLSGPLTEFALGGQELWIDDLCAEVDCVDMEDLTPGSTYNTGDTLVDSGVDLTVQSFTWSDGTEYDAGFARVETGNLAGGWGLDLQLNNVNLDVAFGRPLKGLSVDFGEYGGNLNLEVNGDFRNLEDFADVDGLTIGGTTITVVNGHGNDTGRLYLFGQVRTFAVGGQELWVDNICPESSCVDFESLPPSSRYRVGEFFSDSDARIDVLPFTWSDGTVFGGGFSEVGASGLAGGTGKEMQVNNVNLAFDFGAPLTELTLLFGEYGGNLNIQINGVFRNFHNLTDLDGVIIGAVGVSVVNGLGNDKGLVRLVGIVDDFAVGGQELWIDNVCVSRQHRVWLPLVNR
jgi:hypothetical protein